jgi:hypothetical protein
MEGEEGEGGMSFDILYHTCNLGTRREGRKNPFTG